MTHGGFGNRPDDPFSVDPFGNTAFGQPPNVSAPPPPQPPGEINTLATLSVVFAIIFAPAGALLGHLGLSQIARTGQRGRDRALVGITLSYTVITAAVAALVVWTATSPEPTSTATSPTPTTMPSTTQPTTPPRPLPPPPPATVAPAQLPALLLPPDEMKAITGDAGLVVDKDFHDTDMPPTSQSIYEPLDCIGSFLAVATPAYQGINYQTLDGNVQQNVDSLLQVVQSVVGFTDAAAAQQARTDYLAQWTRCAGKTLTWTMPAEGRSGPITLGAPQDAGDAITTLRNDNLGTPYFRAIAAKDNVLIDLQVSGGSAVTVEPVVAIASRILDRIPG